MFQIGDRIVCIHEDGWFAKGTTATVKGVPGTSEYDDHFFLGARSGMTIVGDNKISSWVYIKDWQKLYKYENLETHGGEHV